MDVLMNNAGIDSAGIPVADMSTERWNEALRVNLTGPFYCCRRFIQERKQQGGGGTIINVTSVHDEVPRAGAADYDSGNVDILVQAPLLDVYTQLFARDFIATPRSRFGHRLHERNKLMLASHSGALAKLHLHSNVGWHNICFISADELRIDGELVESILVGADRLDFSIKSASYLDGIYDFSSVRLSWA
jgi:hypothetical protein